MNTNKNYILIGLAGLLVGIGGTFVGLLGRPDNDYEHRMRNDSMMHDSMSMKGEMNGMMRVLEGKKGDEFDKAFLKEMTVHHQGAVVMAQAALTNAQHQEIKDLAQKIITAQNAEIKQMQEWEKAWYAQ